jgi:hypothetical protein
MALRNCFKKSKKIHEFESTELSEVTIKKLKLIERAFR